MAVGPTVSKIDRGERSEGSGQNEVDYNWQKCNLTLYIGPTIELQCLLNGLPWWRFALSECFLYLKSLM